ncbi:hypothetical protein [Halosegnis longus]|uniref:hypothetical protein n=1 Tax=Halosegnis longus TaxID=2216012 RepID=UPI00129E28A8|nr:hypothetical protein [Halosegnis longus]
MIDACPIDIYVSSSNRRWSYPYRLNTYYNKRPGVADSSETMMIDSGWGKLGDIDKILEVASDLEADTIIGEDMTPAVEGYEQFTPEENARMAWDGVQRLENHSWDGDMLLPIHPHDGSYQYSLDELMHYDVGRVLGFEDHPAFDMRSCRFDLVEAYGGVAIGGLRDLDVEERIEALRSIRNRVGYQTTVHALAPGTEPEMIRFLKHNPRVIDSMDISTPENSVANNKLPDRTWSQDRFMFPTGTDSTTVRASATVFQTIMLNYMLSPLCDDSAIGRDDPELICPDCEYGTHKRSHRYCPKHGTEMVEFDEYDD